MSGTLPTLASVRDASACGCCDGVGVETPTEIWNRPGLPAVQYRIGTHGSFKATLLSRLSAAAYPALHALTTRDDTDPTIALLDATATMADVLTFYQERIANESWLRTATEWRSLAAIGRLTGYEPSPGVAATAYLAFTLEDAPGAPESSLIPAGTRIQSVPPANALPQTFETLADFGGRPEWNAMAAITRQPQPDPDANTATLLVQGIASGIRPGDRLVLTGPNGHWIRIVAALSVDTSARTTQVSLQPHPPNWPPPFQPVPLPPAVFDLQPRFLDGVVMRSTVLTRSWNHADLFAYVRSKRWLLLDVMRSVIWAASTPNPTPAGLDGTPGAFRFRQRAAAFGHNAPAYDTLPAAQQPIAYPDNWDAEAITLNYPWDHNRLKRDSNNQPVSNNKLLPLDHSYAGIAPGGFAVLEDGPNTSVFAVAGAQDRSAVAFTLTGKVTELDLGATADLSGFTRRGTTIHCDSDALTLADMPITDPVQGSTITLARIYLGLDAGQPIAVSGIRVDLPGVPASEIATISAITVNGNVTVLTLTRPLTFAYDVTTLRVNANVVVGTHGAAVAETLGSGDATVPFQTFTLGQPALTYVADPTDGGARTTLELRVNGERWTAQPSLFGAAPNDRVFTTWMDDAAKSHIVFGDGITGARLPTGPGNVTARYRTGIGSPGLVGPGAVSLLMTRPLGVRSVSNPVPTSDAADADTPAMLRQTAPLHVLTLDRVVSLDDYRNFALAYAGIEKALATTFVGVRGRSVLLTVAGPAGAAIDPAGPLARSLIAAVRAISDPYVAVALGGYTPVFFQVGAALKIDPALVSADVATAVQAALTARFDIANRDFGQPVQQSEVIAAIQSVPGVLACDLDAFYRLDGAMLPGVYPALQAATPQPATFQPNGATSVNAEILLLDPRPLSLGGLA